jgi:hypothetical protein
MQTTDYEKQAQDFLDKYGIKFRATLSDSKVAPWRENEKPHEYGEPHHYRVTLSKHEKGGNSKLSFGNRRIDPSWTAATTAGARIGAAPLTCGWLGMTKARNCFGGAILAKLSRLGFKLSTSTPHSTANPMDYFEIASLTVIIIALVLGGLLVIVGGLNR